MGAPGVTFYLLLHMEALHRSTESGARDDGVSSFVDARPRMFAAALHTLGNAADAEEVVQDAWLRWQNAEREAVRNSAAFLTTTTRRLAINRALGARSRRETPLELCIDEAVGTEADPGSMAERGEALESALLLVLEKLSPLERAAYLLREAFNYSHQHIARVIRVSEANCRQLVTRARKHLVERPRVPVRARELRRISAVFSAAAQQGDLAGLEAVLEADILDSLDSKAGARTPAGRTSWSG
jgi:RNA polymerase sigma factor (sigma-70 family)